MFLQKVKFGKLQDHNAVLEQFLTFVVDKRSKMKTFNFFPSKSCYLFIIGFRKSGCPKNLRHDPTSSCLLATGFFFFNIALLYSTFCDRFNLKELSVMKVLHL